MGQRVGPCIVSPFLSPNNLSDFTICIYNKYTVRNTPGAVLHLSLPLPKRVCKWCAKNWRPMCNQNVGAQCATKMLASNVGPQMLAPYVGPKLRTY